MRHRDILLLKIEIVENRNLCSSDAIAHFARARLEAKMEAGENPARSRHCIDGAVLNYGHWVFTSGKAENCYDV